MIDFIPHEVIAGALALLSTHLSASFVSTFINSRMNSGNMLINVLRQTIDFLALNIGKAKNEDLGGGKSKQELKEELSDMKVERALTSSEIDALRMRLKTANAERESLRADNKELTYMLKKDKRGKRKMVKDDR